MSIGSSQSAVGDVGIDAGISMESGIRNHQNPFIKVHNFQGILLPTADCPLPTKYARLRLDHCPTVQ
jgi:hypothetical protein